MDGVTEEEYNSMGKRLLGASENNDLETVVASLKEGADPSFCDEYNCQRTPLMMAAEKGYDKIVEVLLKGGAETECKKHEGQNRKNAFILACETKNARSVELIYKAGGDPLRIDGSGQTMAEYNYRDCRDPAVLALAKKFTVEALAKRAQEKKLIKALTADLYNEFKTCSQITKQAEYENMLAAIKAARLEKRASDLADLKAKREIFMESFKPSDVSAADMLARLAELKEKLDSRFDLLANADDDDCDVCEEYSAKVVALQATPMPEK